MFVSAVISPSLKDLQVIPWVATLINVKDHCEFQDNSAALGGALDFSLNTVNMSSNSSSSGSGSGSVSGSGDGNNSASAGNLSMITLENLVLLRNKASLQGGALHVFTQHYNNCFLTMKNCIITDSAAEVEGGGVFIQGDANLTVINTTFSGCSAPVSSSALGMIGTSGGFGRLVFVSNSCVISPHAYDEGQQIFVQGVESIQVNSNNAYNEGMNPHILQCVGGTVASSNISTLHMVQTTLTSASILGFFSSNMSTRLQVWVGKCRACAVHFYALDRPECYGTIGATAENVCLPCPDGAVCSGGTQVASTDG